MNNLNTKSHSWLIEINEAMKKAVIELMGNSHQPLKTIVGNYNIKNNNERQWNLKDIETFEKAAISFFKFRGPYLQILPLSKYSDQWSKIIEKYNLDKKLEDAFKFEKLYKHQEETIKAIKNHENVILTARTGRGKTEAWLIPILDYLLKNKEKIQNKTKVLLIYPTKALQTDQFHRLIKYISRINEDLNDFEKISIAQLDGDTPENWKDLEKLDIKIPCPRKNDFPECKDCTGNLIPDRDEKKIKLPYKRACNYKADFGWIYATRKDIKDKRPTILIVNTDLINQQLSNINNSLREVITKDIDIIVIDEAHLYGGYYGGHVSYVIRRIEKVRETLNQKPMPPIQKIAASATIGKPEILFRRLLNIPSNIPIRHISEKTIKLDPVINKEILKNDFLRFEKIKIPNNIMIHGEDKEDNAIVDLLNNDPILSQFLEKINTLSSDEYVDLREEFLSHFPFFKHLFYKLHESMESKEIITVEKLSNLLKTILKEIGITKSEGEIDRLVEKIFVLGALFDLIEKRIHVFTWAPNGFYLCLSCGRTYNEPISECVCGGKVVQAHYVKKDNIFYVKGEYCPNCGNFYPELVDSEYDIFSTQTETINYCPNCREKGENSITIESYWRPFIRCNNCGHVYDIYPNRCRKCDSKLVPTSKGYECSNPSCDYIQEIKYNHDYLVTCPNCGVDNKINEININENNKNIVSIVPGYFCIECGHFHEKITDGYCSSCGNQNFVVNLIGYGYLQQQTEDKIEEEYEDEIDEDEEIFEEESPLLLAKKEIIVFKKNLSNPLTTEKASTTIFRRYRKNEKTLYKLGSLYLVELKRNRNHPKNILEKFFRTPEFLASISSRNLLIQDLIRKNIGVRKIKDPVKIEKYPNLLIFGDSYLDVEELADNIMDAELHAYIRSAILFTTTFEKQITLKALIQKIFNDKFEGILKNNIVRAYKRREEIFAELSDYNRISDAIKIHLLPGQYKSFTKDYYQIIHGGEVFVKEGLINVDINISNEELKHLTDKEVELLYELIKLKSNKITKKELKEKYGSVFIILEKKGIVSFKGESELKFSFSPEVFIIKSVNKDSPIHFDPVEKRFVPDWEIKLLQRLGKKLVLEKYYVTWIERANILSKDYSLLAFNALKNGVHVFYSLPYKGSLDKNIRRTLEEYFKAKEINILTSTSSLEVGIDIGSLDLIVLHGTPPSQNSYLQRIGRAGRRSKTSLIISISKRNPIDALYYRKPSELILGDPDPIGLSETNEFIIKAHVIWSILDYIANKYRINWTKARNKQKGRTTKIKIDELERYTIKNDSFKKSRKVYTFHYLLNQPLSALGEIVNSNGRRIIMNFEVINEILEKDKEKIYNYIKDIFSNVRICDVCQTLVANNLESCHNKRPISVWEIIENNNKEIITFAYNEIQKLANGIPKIIEKIKEQINKIGSQEEIADLILNKSDSAEAKILMRLTQKKREIEKSNEKYRELLRTITPYFEFSLREISASVRIILEKENKSELLLERDMIMALREFVPYAITLHETRRYITTRVEIEDDIVGYAKLCEKCYEIYEEEKQFCDICDEELIRQPIFKIKNSYVRQLNRDNEYLFSAYSRATKMKTPKKARGNVRYKILKEKDFQYESELNLVKNGETIAKLIIGKATVSAVTATTIVDLGGYSYEQPIILCTADDDSCNSIVKQAPNTNKNCLTNESHPPSKQNIRLFGYSFVTDCIKIESESLELSHTIAHGIRATLQNVEGLEIRNIGEIIDQRNNSVYVLELVPGGLSALRRLFYHEYNNMKNYGIRKSLLIMNEISEKCSCEKACPNCFMQISCSLNNQELNRTIVRNIKLKDGYE